MGVKSKFSKRKKINLKIDLKRKHFNKTLSKSIVADLVFSKTLMSFVLSTKKMEVISRYLHFRYFMEC